MDTTVAFQEEPLPEPGASAGRAEPVTLSWHHPQGLVQLSFVNVVLRLLTLGIYGFWAKTEVRKRIWAATRLNGEPLAYTGTGKELFVGFLFVFALVLLPIFMVSFSVLIAFGEASPVTDAYQILLTLAVLFLWGMAGYRAQRFRMSRTQWRGIRGALTGSDRTYAWTYFWTAPLIPLTAGWIIPWRATKLQSLLVNDMRFGDRPFTFAASAAPLYRPFAVAWAILALLAGAGYALLTAVIETPRELSPETIDQFKLMFIVLIYGLGAAGYVAYMIVSAWYRARQINHFAAHTGFEGATLRGSLTGRGLMALSVTNFLIIICSLGILMPVAQARSWRYVAENLAIVGDVDLAAVAQRDDQGLTRGEGLAQAFDYDGF